MKRALALALWLAGAAYPFVVYFGLQYLPPAYLVLPLGLLWLARALLPSAALAGDRVWARCLPWVACGFCLWLAVSGSSLGLRVYPVLMNALLLAVFGLSLLFGPPVVERLARLRYPDLPPEGLRYTRNVTIVWCGFFAVNGSIAAALALWGSWAWWTLYNGAISYVLMAALLLGEWCLRPTAAKGRSV